MEYQSLFPVIPHAPLQFFDDSTVEKAVTVVFDFHSCGSRSEWIKPKPEEPHSIEACKEPPLPTRLDHPCIAAIYKHAHQYLNHAIRDQYSPKISRWLSRDPLGEVAGLNLFGYVGNNPVSNTDRLGLAGPGAVLWLLINAPKIARVVMVLAGMAGAEGGPPPSAMTRAIVANKGGLAAAEKAVVVEAAVQTKNVTSLYHYTNAEGLEGILNSGILKPSARCPGSMDVRYGNGQYLTDVLPGSITPGQLSKQLMGIPWQGKRFSHYVEIDVSGLDVFRGRKGVYVLPGEEALDLTGRIIRSGANE